MPENPLLRWWLPALTALAGSLGVTAIWVAIAVLSVQACGWLALVAAADMALLLRLTNAPRGLARCLVAALGTALTVAASYWMIVATHLGFVFGLDPLPSALRLGPVLAWEMTRLSLQTADWVFIGVSLPLAAWLAYGRKISH